MYGPMALFSRADSGEPQAVEPSAMACAFRVTCEVTSSGATTRHDPALQHPGQGFGVAPAVEIGAARRLALDGERTRP
jgi:hypothetical protein